jgi:glycosyltransferase involved in cell wall biosynthesis
MRLCIVMPLGSLTGGAERVLLDFLAHSRPDESHCVLVFLQDGPLVTEAERLGVEVHVIDAGRLRQPRRYLRTVSELWRLLRRERPDFVLSWMEKAHLYASPAGVAAGVKCAFHFPGFLSRFSWMDRLAKLLPGKGVITVSEAAARSIDELWPKRSVQIVRPSVDLAKFDRSALPTVAACRQRLGLPTDGPLIGTIVRLQRWKGPHVLIEAMPRVLEAHPSARCVVIGGRHELERDYEPYLHRLVAELRLERSVLFFGYQPELPIWRKAFDVDVYVSDREPFAVGILEALAMSNPVIAGDGGGTPEIVRDSENGLLVPYGDASALADAITRLLSDEPLRQRLGAAARRSVRVLSPHAYALAMWRAISVLSGM